MSDEQPGKPLHLMIIGFTHWCSFIGAMALGSSLAARILLGSGMIVGILVPIYALRWLIQRSGGGDFIGSDRTEENAETSQAWRVVAYAGLGVPAGLINLGGRLCAAVAETSPGIDPVTERREMADVFALLWMQGAVCWLCVFIYMLLVREWRAASVAGGASGLGILAAVVNALWLWR